MAIVAMDEFDKILALFQKHDTDRNGICSLDEMHNVIVSCCGCSSAHFDKLWTDYNLRPVVNYDHFLRWICTCVSSETVQARKGRMSSVAECSAHPHLLKRSQEEPEPKREEQRTGVEATAKGGADFEANGKADAELKARGEREPKCAHRCEGEYKEAEASTKEDAAKDKLADEVGKPFKEAHKAFEDSTVEKPLGEAGAFQEDDAAKDKLADELGDPLKDVDKTFDDATAEKPAEAFEKEDAAKDKCADEVGEPIEGVDEPSEGLAAKKKAFGEAGTEIAKLSSLLEAFRALKGKSGEKVFNFFQQLSQELQNSKELAMMVLLAAHEWTKDVFDLLSNELRNDMEVAMEALKHCSSHDVPELFELLSEELKHDKEVALEALKRSDYRCVPDLFLLLSEELTHDLEVATQALEGCDSWEVPKLFESFSEELKHDREVALQALKSCHSCAVHDLFKLLGMGLKHELALQALSSCADHRVPFVFLSLPEELKNDKEMAMQALKGISEWIPEVFALLSKDLQSDMEVAIQAVQMCHETKVPDLFKLLSEKVKNDKEVAVQALKGTSNWTPEVFDLLSKGLQSDMEVAIQAVQKCHETRVPDLFKLLSAKVNNDKEVAVQAITSVPEAFAYCSDNLRNDRAFCVEALHILAPDKWNIVYQNSFNDTIKAIRVVRKDGLALEFCVESVRNDKDVAIEAVKQNCWAFRFCSETLRADMDVVEEALKGNWRALEYLSGAVRNHKALAITAVKQNGEALQYFSQELKNDGDVAMEAVKQNGEALQFCSSTLRSDKDIVLLAARKLPTALKFAMNLLSQDADCLAAAGLAPVVKGTVIPRREMCVLSVKFGFSETASNLSTIVADELAKHAEMQRFRTYNPNCFCKRSCDKQYTRLDHPCRGTFSTCEFKQDENVDSAGNPTSKSCWRFSFRHHQVRSKETEGFMLQLEERGELGGGQVIETEMAIEIGLKIFRLKWNYRDEGLKTIEIRTCITNQIADAVLDWLDDEKRDTGIRVLEANPLYESRRFGGGGW